MSTVAIRSRSRKYPDLFAIIDAEDYPLVSRYRWHFVPREHTFYVEAYDAEAYRRGDYPNILMHRLIMDAPDGVRVDHINGDGCDNRRENLRIATHAENMRNAAKHVTTASSQYKGVSWQANRHKWQAGINVDGEWLFLGRFDDELAAAHAYDAGARIHHGKFANLNFPDETEWAGEVYEAHQPHSGYKGVHRSGKRWMARIVVDGETRYLGTYDAPEEAARVYDAHVRLWLGADAELNFPDEESGPAIIKARERKSGYRGVFRREDRWRARLTIDGRQVNLGTFATAEEAARAYDAGVKARGLSLPLNFPD